MTPVIPSPTETSELALIQLHWLLVIRHPMSLSVVGHCRILLKTTNDLCLHSSAWQHVDNSTKNALKLLCRPLKTLWMLCGKCVKLTRTHDPHRAWLNLLITASPFMWWVFLTRSDLYLFVPRPYVTSPLSTPCPNTSNYSTIWK